MYVAENRGNTLSLVSLDSEKVVKRIPVGEFPYDVRTVPSRSKVYVSLWGESKVCVLDSRANAVRSRITVGDHLNAMLLSPDASLLYVACSNTDEAWVIDTASDAVIETIGLRPYAGAPYGSTPNSLALSPDGSTLYVANATNIDVAVADVSKRGRSTVRGLIPVGWYPTALAVSPDGKKLYVANAKGLISKPNASDSETGQKVEKYPYIGGLFNGVVSVIPIPDARNGPARR